MNHLDHLQLNLSNERIRLSQAKTDQEKALRAVFVAQIEREIAGEIKFLGRYKDEPSKINEDELLSDLLG